MMRLAVAGVSVLVAGVLVVVWILNMDKGGGGAAQDGAEEPIVQQPPRRDPVAPVSNTNRSRPTPKGQPLSTTFLQSIPPWVDALEGSADRLQTSFENLVKAHQRVAGESVANRQEKLAELDSQVQALRREMESATRHVDQIEDELKELTVQKAPEIPFVVAYMSERELSETVANARKTWQEASQARTKAEEEYRGQLSKYFEAESDEARDSLAASVDSLKKKFEEAQAAEKTASDALEDGRTKLRTARSEIETTFAALPARGDYTDRLRAAWTAVLQKRKEIEAAETKADEVDRRIANMNAELAQAQSDVTELEAAWKQIHDDAIKAAKLYRLAADRYVKEGTKSAREAADKAGEERDRLDRQDKEAKDAMNEARRKVQELQKSSKNSDGERAAAAAEAERIKAAAQGVITSSHNQIKAAADELLPREQERVEKAGRIRRERMAAEKRGAEATAALEPLQSTRDKLEAEMRVFSDHVAKMETYMVDTVRDPIGADLRALATYLKNYTDASSIPRDAVASVAKRASALEGRIQAAHKTIAPADLNPALKVSLGVELTGWDNARQEAIRVVQEVGSQADAVRASMK
jgi:chromosome segregation ATPase